MATVTAPVKAPTAPRSGSQEAYRLLYTIFTVAPILFGLDKFAQILTNWDRYLAAWIRDLSPFSTHGTMLVIGVIEIVAGLLVAVRPRIGAYVVAAWLAGIIVDLVSTGHYYDIALRDFGLLIGALALGSLARDFAGKQAS